MVLFNTYQRKEQVIVEINLIKHLLDPEVYDQYRQYVNDSYLKDNSKEVWYVYKTLDELRIISDKPTTIDELEAFFFLKYPDSDKGLYGEVFEKIKNADISQQVASALLKALKQKEQAIKLSEEAFKFATGHSDVLNVLSLAKDLEEGVEDEDLEEIETVSDDLEFLLAETVQKPGLRWRLNSLNKSLGSLRKGNFGFLFARPETGKTTFLASEVSHMLTQLKEDSGPIVWFNNEQVGAEVMLRMYQAFFGVTLEALLGNPKRFKKEFQDCVQGKFRLVDDATMDKARVEKIMKQLKPSLTLFDQGDKVKGFAADREDLRLGAIYLWQRELAKQYCPVISVCQADGAAENQKWLTMEHVANAKTSKQAEADWILGIGKIHAEGADYSRYLNISKNKLLGDPDTIPDLRHGRFETYIEPTIARYVDVIDYD